jgi:hypothetical protein
VAFRPYFSTGLALSKNEKTFKDIMNISEGLMVQISGQLDS